MTSPQGAERPGMGLARVDAQARWAPKGRAG